MIAVAPRRASALPLALAALGWLAAAPPAALAVPAQGVPKVFHSPADDGFPGPSLPAPVETGTAEILNLFIDYENDPDVGPSTDPSVVCLDDPTADGDETCAYDVHVKLEGSNVFIADFVPEPGVVHKLTPATNSTELRANWIDRSQGLNSTAPTPPIRARIGTLVLDTSAATSDFAVNVVGVHRVGAALQLDAIQKETIAVPEPGRNALLLPALVGLGLLQLLRLARLRRVARG